MRGSSQRSAMNRASKAQARYCASEKSISGTRWGSRQGPAYCRVVHQPMTTSPKRSCRAQNLMPGMSSRAASAISSSPDSGSH